jgi:hypothetical protein
MLARAVGDRMMQVRLRLQGNVVSVLDGIKAAVPGATVNYAQGCDTSCTRPPGSARRSVCVLRTASTALTSRVARRAFRP